MSGKRNSALYFFFSFSFLRGKEMRKGDSKFSFLFHFLFIQERKKKRKTEEGKDISVSLPFFISLVWKSRKKYRNFYLFSLAFLLRSKGDRNWNGFFSYFLSVWGEGKEGRNVSILFPLFVLPWKKRNGKQRRKKIRISRSLHSIFLFNKRREKRKNDCISSFFHFRYGNVAGMKNRNFYLFSCPFSASLSYLERGIEGEREEGKI